MQCMQFTLIDFRTDSRTSPTPQIRHSMTVKLAQNSELEQDRSVAQLQSYTAKLFGKQDAAFVPSGVFGNQCAILTASTPGCQIILQETSHSNRHQNGALGMISRAVVNAVECPLGYITPDLLQNQLRKKKDYQTKVVVMQFPTFKGIVQPIDILNQCCQIAKKQSVHVHIDGARIFNGLAALNVKACQMAKNVSSLTFCLSKGLCAPLGSVVVGDKEFIGKFKKNMKMLGGILPKPAIFANAALTALKTMTYQIQKDNQIAKFLAQKIAELGWLEILFPIETNIIYMKIKSEVNCQDHLLTQFLAKKNIKVLLFNSSIRMVVHYYIREKQVQRLISSMKQFKQLL